MIIVTHRNLYYQWSIEFYVENGKIIADQNTEQLGIKKKAVNK
ncbi:MAG: hypothetical protein CM15mP54_27470 [Paracoccaceae bacterium]|nr:MAG: hypothetical protein CM15mP54_27470 [Paracoccaceae bacterium]